MSREEPEHGRLIIVDDEPVILNLLSSVFEGEAYEVLAFATGRGALDAMESGGVDVLLTDKNLPDIGGLELLRHAKRIQADAEGIIITGYASLDTVLAAMQLDAFDYIVKPPKDIFDVRRKVRQAFGKVRMGRENRRLVAELKAQNDALESALDELRELQSELIQTEKLAGIGVLAAGIAHEISSPLFGVLGLAEAIGAESDTQMMRGYAGEIVEYANNIKDIVVQLSGYSRDAEREYQGDVVLPQVVNDAARLVALSLALPLETVSVTVDGEADLRVRARSSELQQVFVNLLKNAVEAVAERHGEPSADGWSGRVDVRIDVAGRTVRARVRDNGSGIPESQLGTIFDPFYTTKPPGRGTGLGLNIVYRILTKYRGTVHVESGLENGTTFEVRLPRLDAPPG